MKTVTIGERSYNVLGGWFSDVRRGYWVYRQDNPHRSTRVEHDDLLGMLCESCPTARCEHTTAAELYEQA